LRFPIQLGSGSPAGHPCDLLALLVSERALEGGKIADAALGDADRALGGLLLRAAAEEEFKGKEGQTLSLHTHGKLGAPRLLVVGLGGAGKARGPEGELESLRQAAVRDQPPEYSAAVHEPQGRE